MANRIDANLRRALCLALPLLVMLVVLPARAQGQTDGSSRNGPTLAQPVGLAEDGDGVREGSQRKHGETLLAPFPPEVYDSAVISPDARRIAYVVASGRQKAVVVDGDLEEACDRIAGLLFSPNSKWHAYAARGADEWFIVINGRRQPGYQRVGPPVFSPDSKRLAYVALLADGKRTVVEAPKGPGASYDLISAGMIVFSPDSRRLAYGVVNNGRCYLVVDDEQIGPYDDLGTWTGYHFSPDGSRIALVAKVDKKLCVVVDGKRQSPYHEIGDLAFGPAGKRLAYSAAAAKGGKWQVIIDGQPQTPYDAIGEGTLTFSPDGKHVAYVAGLGSKWLVVVDGRELTKYDGIDQMTFSPDSRFVAYVARLGDTRMVVINNRQQKLYDRVGGGTLVFSRSSERLGYVARVGRESYVIVGPKQSKPYDMAAYLNFTPDSRHYIFAATKGEVAFSVVDDRESTHQYDAIWNVRDGKLPIDSPTRFHYLAVKQGNIYLVEEELE